mmetsp:Transcript_2516/g.4334  ORF Transcript_2516/g.4334 Transcript_2516/m.4334 type:complete len:280 (-) Transcript_2516:804-1643(-)
MGVGISTLEWPGAFLVLAAPRRSDQGRRGNFCRVCAVRPAVDEIEKAGGVPRHVAVIMDGNRRWARVHGRSLREGYRRGVDALRELIAASIVCEIRILTIYAFSAENRERPLHEVVTLHEILDSFLWLNAQSLFRQGVRLCFVGDWKSCISSSSMREMISLVEKRTADNDRLLLNVAWGYGGRQEILRAARLLAEDVRVGRLHPEDIGEETFRARLDVADSPDLLIRTGGEQRLSNFLLWQAAYAELVFSPRLWPDFGEDDLKSALADYSLRHRRLGAG